MGVVHALAIDPSHPETLYATNYNGVFKSTDAGQSWKLLPGSPIDVTIQALVVDPVTPAKIYAGMWGKGVYKSNDGGVTWSELNNGLSSKGVHVLLIDPRDPSRVYAGTDSAGVFVIDQEE